MITKKEILAYAKQNDFVYPKLKVIFGFWLCGGTIGGFFLGLYNSFLHLLEISDKDIIFILNSFIQSVLISLLFSLLGILFGAIPALLTSLYLTATDFFIRLPAKLAKLNQPFLILQDF